MLQISYSTRRPALYDIEDGGSLWSNANFHQLSMSNDREKIPIRWRRIIDSIAFIFAVGVAVWVKYGLDGSWYAAIG
jgi:hypothetical protein